MERKSFPFIILWAPGLAATRRKEYSPRRKPWVEAGCKSEPQRGERGVSPGCPWRILRPLLPPLRGWVISLRIPTAYAVGYILCAASRLSCVANGGHFLFFNRPRRRCLVQRNGCIFTSHQGKMHIERSSKRLTRRCTPFLPSVQKCGPIVCVG